jgi:hypothetical protein
MSDLDRKGGGSPGAPADGAEAASPTGSKVAGLEAPIPAGNDGNDYKVGPGRPPKETRFPKGVSGNPSGRRKRNDSFWDIVHEVAYGKVRIKDHGEVPRIAIVLRQCFADAMKGDKRARAECIELMTRFSPPPKPTNENHELGAEANREVVQAFLEDWLARQRAPEAGDADK